MVKRIVPPMSNEIITLVKDTSLARIIAVHELIWSGQTFIKSCRHSGYLAPVLHCACIYLVFNGGLTLLFGLAWRESWISSSVRRIRIMAMLEVTEH